MAWIRTATLLIKPALLFGVLFSVAVAAFAQDPNPNFKEELDQQTPQQAKHEAQKPDAKASAGDLAKATQNPIASLISVPLQNFTDFNIGPFDRNRNTVIQAQPVIPIPLGENWNLITRTIGALVFQPNITQPNRGTFGLNDINPSFFLSPAHPGKLIWGAGPTFLIPTATDNVLGTGKFSIGPGVVVAVQPGKWTVGLLVSNLFSVAGPSNRANVNAFTSSTSSITTSRKAITSHSRRSSPPTGTLPVATLAGSSRRRHRKNHALGFSASKRQRPGLRQCQTPGQFFRLRPGS
jgi:hypothetical protein